MWFKKKIKETPKGRLYGNRYNSQNYSVWDNMSIIEKFVMIMGPIGIAFIIYMMLDYTEYIWWLRLCISIGITTIVWILIFLFASLMAKMDIQ